MTLTKPRDLAIAAVVAAVLAYLLLTTSYDKLLHLPTLAGLTLLVVAVIDGLLALALRQRLAGKPGTRPVPPLTAVRVVALAKASSMLGALMLGAWIGELIFVLPRRAEIVAAASDTPSGVVGVICAALLIAAGLWLEYCCKAPEPPQPSDGREDAGQR
ncbi:MAG: DUF3180 domain-containing protein [Sciscionella sp.]|nr:DUF3180 domain-containing protein [Sciscionella sp.]